MNFKRIDPITKFRFLGISTFLLIFCLNAAALTPSRSFPSVDSREREALFQYLLSKKPTIEQKKAVERIVANAQIINLVYSKQTPILSDEDRKEILRIAESFHAYSNPVDVHSNNYLLPCINVTFSKNYPYSRSFSDYWLDEMKIPLQNGYSISQGCIFFGPNPDDEESILNYCNDVSRKLFGEFQMNQSRFGILSDLKSTAYSNGKWSKLDERKYPSIHYSYGDRRFINNGSPETIPFCLINIEFDRIAGFLYKAAIDSEVFPDLGIEIRYEISSSDSDFNKWAHKRIQSSIDEFISLEGAAKRRRRIR